MKLSSKLSLVLIVTVLTAGIIISVFSLQATKSFFGQYIFKVREGQMAQWEQIFSQYYKSEGSWQGIEALRMMGGPMMGAGKGKGQGRGMNRQSIVLTDESGKVLNHPEAQQIGAVLDEHVLEQGRPIKVGGKVVGYLFPAELFIPQARVLEQKFMSSVLYAVILGTVITSLLAIGLGLWWSRKLTKPLEALASASQKVAKGNFTNIITVDSKDELGSVARAFNTMAQELEKSQRVRQQLFADISHELRTPLTVLGSRLEASLEGSYELDPSKTSSLYDEVIRLQGLVKELQNLSKLEAGQIKLNLMLINPHQLTADLNTLLEAEAEARNIQLNISVHPDLKTFRADPARLKQIILNLISNAFRYTPAGGEVFFKIYPEHNFVIFEVIDTGSGISANDLPYIFQRFYRADKSRNRATGGVGLGLAIAKGYVDAHGGTIDVKSELGKGTKFIIRLPKRE